MQLCLLLFKDTGTSTFLLLLFEPLSIAFDTLQVNLSTILVRVPFCPSACTYMLLKKLKVASGLWVR